MKIVPIFEAIFSPELPGPQNAHHVRDGEGDGKGGAKFKSTHFRPDSASTFPYEPPHPHQQSEEELETMLNLESFMGGGGIAKRNMDPAMSLYRLSYGGGESENYGNHEFSDSDYQINPNGDPENKREEDRVLSIDLVAGNKDKEKEEEEFLDHMNELRNVRSMACADGNKQITTKNGWSNGAPSRTGVEEQTDEEVKQELELPEDEFGSIKPFMKEYADTDYSTMMAGHHMRSEKEDEDFFDEDEDMSGHQDHGTIRQ